MNLIGTDDEVFIYLVTLMCTWLLAWLFLIFILILAQPLIPQRWRPE